MILERLKFDFVVCFEIFCGVSVLLFDSRFFLFGFPLPCTFLCYVLRFSTLTLCVVALCCIGFFFVFLCNVTYATFCKQGASV